MRRNKVVMIAVALCFVGTSSIFGQVHDRFENICPVLQNSVPPDLLQYLNGVKADEQNAWCIVWSIHQLGSAHYANSVAILVKFLDFRRPPTPLEKLGFYVRMQITEELFPAAEALELIGDAALPEVSHVIERDSSSATTRENAIAVWIEAYKYERPRGIALLKQEEMRSNDAEAKEQLRRAMVKALAYCGPLEVAACKAATQNGAF